MNSRSNRRGICPLLLAAFALILLTAAAPQLTEEQWALLGKGELIKEVKNEGGTQSGAHSFGFFKHSPDVMWKVICSLESYDNYIERTTVSVLIDEAAKERVLKSGAVEADDVEKLFAGMKPGYKRIDGDGKWTIYSYQRNALPWPFSDRWVLLEMSHDDKAMKQEWKRLAGMIKEDYGSWQVFPAKGGALGEMNIHLDLDLVATGPFVAYGMDISLPETYKAFEAMAQDLEKGKLKK